MVGIVDHSMILEVYVDGESIFTQGRSLKDCNPQAATDGITDTMYERDIFSMIEDAQAEGKDVTYRLDYSFVQTLGFGLTAPIFFDGAFLGSGKVPNEAEDFIGLIYKQEQELHDNLDFRKSHECALVSNLQQHDASSSEPVMLAMKSP